MKIFAIIPTTGRADIVRLTVGRLAKQTRPADGILVIAVQPEDVPCLAEENPSVEVAFTRRGVCRQRNHGLALIEKTADLIAFFDDDFVPAADYLDRAEQLFTARSEIVGATGRIVADGVSGRGYSFEDALRLLELDKAGARPQDGEQSMRALYGCNMVVRAASLDGLRFDENLPLYGWQEDIDFSYQLGRRGLLVKTPVLSGVHMGTKKARTPGRRLGYSQIANPLYLLRKETMPKDLGLRLMAKNVAANAIRSVMSDPYVDRKGRLAGNLLAISDLLGGRLDPRRILELD